MKRTGSVLVSNEIDCNEFVVENFYEIDDDFCRDEKMMAFFSHEKIESKSNLFSSIV